MKFSPADQNALFNIMRWRRDVRHFLTDPIPDELLTKLCEAMHYAPSVGNSRPWRIFQVESTEKREAVYSLFEASNRQAARIYDEARANKYQQLKLEAIRTAPQRLNKARQWLCRTSISLPALSVLALAWFRFLNRTP